MANFQRVSPCHSLKNSSSAADLTYFGKNPFLIKANSKTCRLKLTCRRFQARQHMSLQKKISSVPDFPQYDSVVGYRTPLASITLLYLLNGNISSSSSRVGTALHHVHPRWTPLVLSEASAYMQGTRILKLYIFDEEFRSLPRNELFDLNPERAWGRSDRIGSESNAACSMYNVCDDLVRRHRK